MKLYVKCFVLSVKMNEIVNKFLLVGDKFMTKMHLKQPGFTYSACGPFTRNKDKIETFMQNGNTDLKLQVIQIWWLSKRISFSGLQVLW